LLRRTNSLLLLQKMKISKTHFVEAHYRLKEENAEGKIIEETFGKDPLGFVYGVGMMIPGFELEIEGLEVGGKNSFQVVAEEAYGLYNEDNVVSFPKEHFGDQETQDEYLIEGKQIAMQDNAGGQHMGIVKELKDENVTIDFNHPMAGYDLFFEVEIISIRETTSEELQQMGLSYEG